MELAGSAIAVIALPVNVHVVVCVNPPPPLINIVSAVVYVGEFVIVKLVKRFVTTLAVIFLTPPPFQAIEGIDL